MPIRGVGRAAKRCYSLPLADARGLPDAMEHCSKRDATRRDVARNRRAIKAGPDKPSCYFAEQTDSCRSVGPATHITQGIKDQGTSRANCVLEIIPICS